MNHKDVMKLGYSTPEQLWFTYQIIKECEKLHPDERSDYLREKNIAIESYYPVKAVVIGTQHMRLKKNYLDAAWHYVYHKDVKKINVKTKMYRDHLSLTRAAFAKYIDLVRNNYNLYKMHKEKGLVFEHNLNLDYEKEPGMDFKKLNVVKNDESCTQEFVEKTTNTVSQSSNDTSEIEIRFDGVKISVPVTFSPQKIIKIFEFVRSL